MKRTVLTAILAIASLPASTAAAAPTKLRLLVEGPFALCETDDQKSLRVLLPESIVNERLSRTNFTPSRTHFTPGMKSLVAEIELGRRHKDYTLSALGRGPGGLTRTNVQATDSLDVVGVVLDTVSGVCKPEPGSYYVSVMVPRPDSIRPVWPVMANVSDCSRTQCRQGECRKPYGTSSLLTYDSIDLESLKLTADGTRTADGTQESWSPQVDADTGYLTIFVRSLHPEGTGNRGDPHDESLSSYKEMIKMLGPSIVRCFTDPATFPAPRAAEPGRDGRHSTPRPQAERVFPARHNDCHAPQILVCQLPDCQFKMTGER